MRTVLTFSAAALLAVGAGAQQQEAAATPPKDTTALRASLAGHWVPEHPASSGLGTIVEFKPDGTINLIIGVVASDRYQLEGDTLVLSPATTEHGAQPQRLNFRIEGAHLYERASNTPTEVAYRRITAGRTSDPAIVGEWKNDQPPAGTKLDAAIRNTVYTYTRDGVFKIRTPLRSTTGRYDLDHGTFTVEDPNPTISPDPAATRKEGQTRILDGRFDLRDGKLHLIHSGARGEEVYVRDDFE
jgi:hypothetical protein